jgi:hypothetical protein
MLALGKKDQAAFERSLSKEAERLWLALSFEGERPPFSFADFGREVEKRFDAVVLLISTSNCRHIALTMGHRIDCQEPTIEQHGFKSQFGHYVYDMMVSSGYSPWFWDGKAFHGGWATEYAICEIRWGEIKHVYEMWWRVNEDAGRRKTQAYIADRLDAEELAVSKSTSAPLNALGVRMRCKATNTTVDKLRDSGLEGQDLTMAFVHHYSQFRLATTRAHEGRHSIDKRFFADDYKRWSTSEKEFRAMLSEITFSPNPYLALAENLLQPVTDSGYGKASLRVRRVLQKWMKEHLSEIEGIDADRPLLVQAHLLTSDQIRQCFTAADPMAIRSK